MGTQWIKIDIHWYSLANIYISRSILILIFIGYIYRILRWIYPIMEDISKCEYPQYWDMLWIKIRFIPSGSKGTKVRSVGRGSSFRGWNGLSGWNVECIGLDISILCYLQFCCWLPVLQLQFAIIGCLNRLKPAIVVWQRLNFVP
jgi:hypothetical protein